jgi:hypothetical protein
LSASTTSVMYHGMTGITVGLLFESRFRLRA